MAVKRASKKTQSRRVFGYPVNIAADRLLQSPELGPMGLCRRLARYAVRSVSMEPTTFRFRIDHCGTLARAISGLNCR
jgi:hypothetical protein